MTPHAERAVYIAQIGRLHLKHAQGPYFKGLTIHIIPGIGFTTLEDAATAAILKRSSVIIKSFSHAPHCGAIEHVKNRIHGGIISHAKKGLILARRAPTGNFTVGFQKKSINSFTIHDGFPVSVKNDFCGKRVQIIIYAIHHECNKQNALWIRTF